MRSNSIIVTRKSVRLFKTSCFLTFLNKIFVWYNYPNHTFSLLNYNLNVGGGGFPKTGSLKAFMGVAANIKKNVISLIFIFLRGIFDLSLSFNGNNIDNSINKTN